MYLLDLYTGEKLSLQRLHTDWQEFKQEDPDNHADTFKTEFFQILDATMRGRNDCEIVGLTSPELWRLFNRLMKEC